MTADFQFANGCTARMICGLLSARLLRMSAAVYGTAGELRVQFPFLPHIFHAIIVRSPAGVRRERVEGFSTYRYQLRAFVDAARDGGPAPTSAADAIANMRVIDAVYAAAGLAPRGAH
jgi:predicted dehydrogenase